MKIATEQMLIFILILLINISYPQTISPTASSICQDSQFQNLLQSGTYSLTNQRSQSSRVNSFQIVVNYNIPSWGFNVAVSTGRINGFNQAAGTDYSIRGSRKTNTNIANFVLLINQDSSWTSIRASFLISSRSDFFLGAFFPDTINLFSNTDSSFLAQYIIPNWSPSTTAVNFIYLISGLKTSDNSFNFNLDLSQASFNIQNGLISVKVSTNANPSIQMIYISYIVFFNSAPYSLSSYNPLLSNPPSSINFYEGINSINNLTIGYEGYAINTTISTSSNIPCFGSNCPSKCINPTKCNSTGGKISFNQCFICGFQEIFSNEKCNFRCFENQTWNGNVCQCKNGYVKVNGQCSIINCSSNQIWNGLLCICANGYQRIGGICQKYCLPYSFWNGSQCVCNTGYIKVNDKCVIPCIQNAYVNQKDQCICFQNYYFKYSANACVFNSCSSNQIFDTNLQKCVCKEGNLYSRNQCMPKCPGDPNAVIYKALQTICICLQGYDLSNGKCVRSILCNKQFQILSNDQCVCIVGYQYNSQRLCIPNCKQNEILQGDVCQCRNGYGRNTTGFCVMLCPINQYLAHNCTCIPSYTRNSKGICTLACGLNQVLINNKCECATGFLKVGQICVSICRVNQIYDTATSQCVCKQGYGINTNNNLCDICPLNSRSSGLLTGCICNNGYKWNSNSQRCQFFTCQPNSSLQSSGLCVCNSGYYLDGNDCKKIPTCPPRSSWTDSLVCKCDFSGQFLINNVCQPCIANSAWNGTSCVCRNGYNLISGNCVQCSLNSQYLRGNCVCNFGYYGNGITCNSCYSSCGTCTNGFANSCLTCANVSYTLTNGFCNLKACDNGYFLNSLTLICDKCPDYCLTCTNGSICTKCNDGFQVIYMVDSSDIICGQICGDGKLFYRQCDDNNTRSGDGCSSSCTVEFGWTCFGGSLKNKSQCYNITPISSFIIPEGNVALNTQILQGISMTYIPQNLTNNGCLACDFILSVTMISNSSVPTIRANYISDTQYKFLIRFNNGFIAANQFIIFSVRINPGLNSFFSATDMQQMKIVIIDLAKLVKFQNVGTLSLTDTVLTNQSTSTSNSTSNISIPGLPAAGVAILFPN